MDTTPIHVLLVEDNPEDAVLLSRALRKANSRRFTLVHVEYLADGLKRIAEEDFDVVLLDLSLPDGYGLSTVTRMRAGAPDLPIVVLTGHNDEDLAMHAVQAGAQDYLIKGEISNGLLIRAIRYALERHRLLQEIHQLALIDELTGLYNRRGFYTLGRQYLKVAQRTQQGALLLYADVDDLKGINDAFGYEEGDRVLRDAANILKSTFRDVDIVARVGGDVFMVFALQATANHADLLIGRLQTSVREYNANNARRHSLILNTGMVYSDQAGETTIDALIAQADEALHQQKRAHRRSAPLLVVGTTTGGPGQAAYA